MKIFSENDVVSLTKAVDGVVIGERRNMVLPIGTIATVVNVYGNPSRPDAYEIEAYIVEKDCYVLATIEADSV
jgi:hypothetical protein